MKKITYSTLICFLIMVSSCQQNNFSESVIKEFLLLDKSLKKSTKIMEQTTRYLIASMEETAKTKVQYQDLIDKVKEFTQINDSINEFIDQLREQLIEETGGSYNYQEAISMKNKELEGTPKGLKETKIVAQFLFDDASHEQQQFSKVQELDQQIQTLKKQYISLFESIWDNKTIQLIAFPHSKDKETAIQTLIQKITFHSSLDYMASDHKKKTWEAYTLGNRPLAAVLPVLRTFQTTIRQSEYEIIHFLNQQLNTTFSANYDRFEIFAQTSKPNIRLGETYEAQISLGTYSSKAVFSVIIEGDTLEAIDGKAIYRTRPNRIGRQLYTPKICVKNELTGEIEQFRKEFLFEVIK